MSAPLRPRSPLWSVLLRFGAGFGAFGLFVILFSYGDSLFGFGVFGVGVACLLAAFVLYLQDRPRRR